MNFDQHRNLLMTKFQQNKTEIMTGAGIGGVIISVIGFVKATVNATRKIDARKKELEVERLKAKEIFMLCWRDYIFPGSTLIASLSVIAASDKIQAKQIGGLASEVMVSRALLDDHKKALKEVLSDEKEEEVEEKAAKNTVERVLSDPGVEVYPTGNGNELFIESLDGTVFRSSKEAVHNAFNRAERRIRDFECCSVNDWRDELDLKGTGCGELLGFNNSTNNGHIDYKLRPSEYLGELCWIIQVKTQPIDHYDEIYPYR